MNGLFWFMISDVHDDVPGHDRLAPLLCVFRNTVLGGGYVIEQNIIHHDSGGFCFICGAAASPEPDAVSVDDYDFPMLRKGKGQPFNLTTVSSAASAVTTQGGKCCCCSFF